jgi:hypothetical protein
MDTDLERCAACCRWRTTPPSANASAPPSAMPSVFATWLADTVGQTVDLTRSSQPDQRIHEYKRQLLNLLHVVVAYHPARDDPRRSHAARVLRREGGTRVSPGEIDHQGHPDVAG